ncbi:MAG: hypothetical protein ACJAVR_002016 [Paracoccaceae bacterium]|jgi:hypothetical protein
MLRMGAIGAHGWSRRAGARSAMGARVGARGAGPNGRAMDL